MQSKKDPQKRKKVAAGLAVAAIAATAIVGGTAAMYTDSDVTETQTLQAGTLSIDVEEPNGNPGFEIPIKPMAAGDTFQRYVNLKNTGNLPTNPLTLSQENGGGHLITGTYGVSVEVESCMVPWTNGKCEDESHTHSLSKIQLKNWTDEAPLEGPGLEPGETVYYKFSTSLPAGAPNDYQAEASWAQYTFGGIQRGSVHHGKDGTVTPNPEEEDKQLEEAAELTVRGTSGRTMDVSWTSVPRGTIYRVERSLDGASTNPEHWGLVYLGKGTSFTDATVEPGTEYFYRVTVYGSIAGDKVTSDLGSDWTWMDDAPVRARVTTPTVWSTNRDNNYRVGWTWPGGAKEIKVYEASSDDFAEAQLIHTTADQDANTFSTTGSMGEKRYFWVEASDAHSEVRSPAVEAIMPITPTSVTVRATKTTADISWEGPEGATYVLRRGKTVAYEGSDTSFRLEGLDQGQYYGYELLTTYGEATSITNVGFRTESASATNPENINERLGLTATATYQETTLSWNRLADASSYTVYASEDGTFPDASILGLAHASAEPVYSGTDTTVTLPSDEGRVMYYRIHVNTNQGVFTSSPLKVQSPMISPALELINDDGGQITATWSRTKLEGVTYELRYRAQGGEWITLEEDFEENSYILTGLQPGPYTFNVIARAQGLTSTATQTIPVSGMGVPQPRATNGGQGVTNVSWKLLTGAQYYTVEVRRAGTEAWGAESGFRITAGMNTSSAEIKPLNLEELEIRVLAHGAGDEVTISPIINHRTSPILENASTGASFAPEGLVIDPALKANDRISHFRYSVATDPSMGDAQVVYMGEDLERVVLPYGADTGRLYVRVEAIDLFGGATPFRSNPIELFSPPASPTALNAILVEGTTYTLTWEPAARANGYQVRVGNQVIATTAGTSATVQLEGGRTYNDLKVYATATYAHANGGGSTTVPSFDGAGATILPQVGVPTVSSPETTPKSATIAWQGSSHAASYALERSAAAAFTNPVKIYEGTATRFVDPAVTAGNVYYYRVTMVATNGTSSVSPVLTVEVKYTLMELNVEGVASNAQKLTWEPVEGATSYRIYRSGQNTTVLPTSPTATVNAPTTTYNATGLTSGFYYTYKVAAYAGTEPIAMSDPKSATAPLAPVTIEFSDSNWGTKTLTVTVGGNTNVSRYLEASYDGGETWQVTSSATSPYTTTLTAPCEPGQDCLLRAYALDNLGEKYYSNELELELAPNTPGTPGSTVTYDSAAGKANVSLTLTNANGAMTYRLERRVATATGDWTNVGVFPASQGSTSTLSDDSASFATNYHYRVTAIASSGAESRPGSPASVTVTHLPPTLSATAVDARTVTLTWDRTTATPVKVYRNGGLILNSSEPVTSFTDTGLAPNATYSYIVTVGDQFSGSSNLLQVKTLRAAPVITSVVGASTSMRVNWDTVNANSVLVQYSTDPNFSVVYNGGRAGGSATTHNITNLVPATTYYVRLVAEWSTTETSTSTVVASGTATTAPTPSATTQTEVGKTGAEMTISWNAVQGAESYLVEWGTTLANMQGVTVDASTLSHSTGFTLNYYTNHYYRVTAKTAYASAASSILSVITPEGQSVMAEVTNLTDFSLTVDIDWTENNSDSRLILKDSAGTTMFSQIIGRQAQGARTSHYVYGMHLGETYTLTLVSSSGSRPRAAPLTIQPAPYGPANMDGLNIGTAAAPEMSITWDAYPGATGYELYRTQSTSANFQNKNNWTLLYSGSQLGFIDPGQKLNQGYILYALTPDGKSMPSYIQVFDASKTTIQGFKAKANSNTSATLTWLTVEGTAGTAYYCSGISNGNGAVVDYPTLNSTSIVRGVSGDIKTLTTSTSNGGRIYCVLGQGSSNTNFSWMTALSVSKLVRWD